MSRKGKAVVAHQQGVVQENLVQHRAVCDYEPLAAVHPHILLLWRQGIHMVSQGYVEKNRIILFS